MVAVCWMAAFPASVIDIDRPRDREAIDDRPNDVSIFWKIAGNTKTRGVTLHDYYLAVYRQGQMRVYVM